MNAVINQATFVDHLYGEHCLTVKCPHVMSIDLVIDGQGSWYICTKDKCPYNVERYSQLHVGLLKRK